MADGLTTGELCCKAASVKRTDDCKLVTLCPVGIVASSPKWVRVKLLARRRLTAALTLAKVGEAGWVWMVCSNVHELPMQRISVSLTAMTGGER